jgi:hypothetical protein
VDASPTALRSGEAEGREPVMLEMDATTERLPVHRRLFRGWMVITARFGFVQTLVILSFFYLFLIGPIALGGALARADFLHKRGLREGGSAWNVADSAKPDLERAKLAS